ncbi:MAG: helix-turn-helix domain-containing protein [Gaiellaceae bacterium]
MLSHGEHVREASGRLLSVNEAAEMLSVSRPTIYRLVRRRELPASRVGARLRFRPEHVDEYVDSRRVGARP